MALIAAVMTGPGAGAIATIQLCGNPAEAVLRSVFRRADGKPLEIMVGQVLLGDIFDNGQSIDQVTVGCEGPDTFAIHCHGNPLIVERIMELLQRRGVQPVRAEQLLARVLENHEVQDSIDVEAKVALTTVKTVEGARIITNQAKAGLGERARRWLADLDSLSLEEITAQAKQILRDSETARLILSGCTIALVGPPNTGKSTLLNTLAEREKAIVTEIAGTTRDWVSAEIHIPPLAATLLDTAGLDSALAAGGNIDQTAQHKSLEALGRADLILLVLDASQPAGQLPASLLDILINRRTITVLNKTDLVPHLDPSLLAQHLRHTVHISAKQETGLKDLIRAIHEICGLAGFGSNRCVAFTVRQIRLLKKLCQTVSKVQVRSIITQLLEGTVSNFAAHFDMLGFGNAVQNNFHEAWGALSNLWYAMEKALCTEVIPITTGVALVDRVRAEFFSDSVILYTASDSDEDLIAMLIVAGKFFGESLRTCVPLRGGIGHGRFQMDPVKRLFMGESLVKAYRIGEDAQWLGIILDEKVVEITRKTRYSKYVVILHAA